MPPLSTSIASFLLLCASTAQAAQDWEHKGLEAILAAKGGNVALVGMGVVFVALTVLFFVMLLLDRLFYEPPGSARANQQQPADEPEQTETAVPRELVAVIATALELERRQRVSPALSREDQVQAGRGWAAVRWSEQVQRQRIFHRRRR